MVGLLFFAKSTECIYASFAAKLLETAFLSITQNNFKTSY